MALEHDDRQGPGPVISDEVESCYGPGTMPPVRRPFSLGLWIANRYSEDGVAFRAWAVVYGGVYSCLMRFAHRFNWHHVSILHPDGDRQVWCKWCGLRATPVWGGYYTTRQ